MQPVEICQASTDNALNPYGTSQLLTSLPDTHPRIQIAGYINVGPTVEDSLNILAVGEYEDRITIALYVLQQPDNCIELTARYRLRRIR